MSKRILEKEPNISQNFTKCLSNEVDDLKEVLMRAEAQNESFRFQQTSTPAGGASSTTPTSQVKTKMSK